MWNISFFPAYLEPVYKKKRATQAIGLTLGGRQKIARVYKQNFTGRVTRTTRGNLMRGYTQRVWKQLESWQPYPERLQGKK